MKKIRIADTAVAGDKKLFLGETFSKLFSKGISVLDDFATTAFVFEQFLTHYSLHSRLYDLMLQLNKKNYSTLKETGTKARKSVLDAELPKYQSC